MKKRKTKSPILPLTEQDLEDKSLLVLMKPELTPMFTQVKWNI